MPVSAVESQDNSQFDQEVDVLVVGSGAGALTAAVVARVEGCKDVLVVEKSA
ncbi:MAG: FAD-binding protein, partial [Ketobacter sp.]